MQSSFDDGSVAIRRFRPDDVATVLEAARESIEELCHWMVWCHPGYNITDCRAFITRCQLEWDEGCRYSFAICSSADGALLGSVGLSALDRSHHFANLGYWVRSTRTRHGVATAGVRLAARFAFQQLGLNRLELIIPVGNQASVRVAQKAGAHAEGVLKHRLMMQGKPHDALCYSLVASQLNSP